ncbi:protein kinase domain-containing protein [Nannocystaceae bacterium ST9]
MTDTREPHDVDEPDERSGDDERVATLPEPLGSLPAWWGPLTTDADKQQLGALDCDLAKYVAELAIDEEKLLAFANSLPRRRFLVCEKLSVSRWAGVYIAIDCYADRAVVLKISRRSIDLEARLAVGASHPNVVTVHDTLVCEGHPTIVLEWCSQGSLHGYARHSRDWKRVLARALEAGRGLAHCHSRGTVHGDVKPANFLIADEVGKLADFGIARGETLQGDVAGTVGFAPPERDLGVWTLAGDVYSYARALQWSLAGFRVPDRVHEFLAAAADDDPERRPTLSTLLANLEQVLNDERERPRRDRQQARRRRWARIQVAIAVVWAAMVTSTVVLAGVCSLPSQVEWREPSVSRAIELAEVGDSAGALLEYHRLNEANVALKAADLLRLSRGLLDSAERESNSSDPMMAAIFAEVTATRALEVADDNGNVAQVVEATELRARARAITPRRRDN